MKIAAIYLLAQGLLLFLLAASSTGVLEITGIADALVNVGLGVGIGIASTRIVVITHDED